MTDKTPFLRRALMSFIGCVIIGIGDGFLRLCNFGNLPFTVMSLSAASLVGCRMGAAQLTINIAMFIPGAFFERRRVNIGTLMNAVFVGFASDITVRLAGMAGDMTAFSLRLVFLAAGYAVYCFGCAVFLGADAGCAPYDMINFILVAHTPLSYRLSRVICDVACVAVGIAVSLAATGNMPSVGAGTLLLAFGTGPTVQLFLTLMGKNKTVSK